MHKSLTCSAAVILTILAANGPLNIVAAQAGGTVVLSYSIEPVSEDEEDTTTASLIVGGERVSCRPRRYASGIKVCSLHLTSHPTFLRAELKRSGYVPVAVNVPSLDFNGDTAAVNLGKVAFKVIKAPKVLQVRAFRTITGTVYQASLENSTPKRYLLDSLVFKGVLPPLQCAAIDVGPTFYYLGDTLLVTAIGGDTLRVRGNVTTSVEGQPLRTRITGYIRENCGFRGAVRLSVPMTLELPPQSQASVRLAVPDTIFVVNSVHSPVRGPGYERYPLFGVGEAFGSDVNDHMRFSGFPDSVSDVMLRIRLLGDDTLDVISPRIVP